MAIHSATAVVAGADSSAQVIETHCATVFFSGERAYKVKKPLDLGFVDFRSPASRRRACHRELELNRQFAPDVYLGVDAIGPADGEPVDWAVVMRRMPSERRLSSLITSGADVIDSVRDLARQLAVHHAQAVRSTRTDEAGTPDQLRRRWTENFDALRSWTPTVLDPDVLAEIAHLALNYVYGRHALLFARVAAGRIRDGHGDLLADDVFCLDDRPRILDCLEFDDDLRAVDGLDDAACLAMDLERLGATGLGDRFIDWFCEYSGYTRIESLIHHYVAYRAVVRMKVACVRWSQGDQASLPQAQRFAEIALKHLRAGQPRLILVGGTPGTGKSTVAGALADHLGAVLLGSDRVRKESAGIPPDQAAGQPWQRGLYAPPATEDTYDRLIEIAGMLLSYGETVVLDASWSTHGERIQARQAGETAFCVVQEIVCFAPPEVVDARLAARWTTRDPSDATPEIARLMEKEFQSWPEAARLSTLGTVAETLRDAEFLTCR
jgi:aminoglycoside phosphotransferase family enzyme/predicted kinase